MTAEMIGHAAQERAVIDALAAGRMPHAWLLAGPQGVGKASFAARAAAFLLADGDDRAARGADGLTVEADHPTLRLISSGAHPEYLWLTREVPESRRGKSDADDSVARNITIGQVRQLLVRLRTRPAIARWRAVIIDSIDDMERSAANALLKIIEEPPEQTIFFLISHSPGRVLPTIRSRCRLLRFAPLPDDAVAAILARMLPDPSPDTVTPLVAMAHGAPGRALLHADLDLTDVNRALDIIATTGDSDNRHRVALAKAVAGTSERPRLAAMLALAETMAQRQAIDRTLSKNPEPALALVSRIQDIARYAVTASEDGTTVGFAVGTAFAEYHAAISRSG